MDHINLQRTRDVLLSLICIGILLWAAGAVLGQFVDAIIILLLAMAVAFLLTPAVNFLEKYHIPRLFAALLVYVIILAAIGGLGYGLVFTLIQQTVSFSNTIYNFAVTLPDKFQTIINFLHQQGGIPDENIKAVLDQIQGTAFTFAQGMATNAFNFFFIITNAFLDILLVAVLSFYLTLDGKRMRDSIVNLVNIAPKRWLSNIQQQQFEDALNRVVGNYIRGQLTLAVLVGGLTSLVCVITGLGNYALIAGLLAFIFETIPMVGPGLASITPIFLSLLLPNPFPRTFEVIVLFIVIQALESNILGPRIVGHAVGLHPVATIMALLVGAKLFGILGALLATPAVAVSWVVIASIYRSIRGETAEQMLAKRRAMWTIPRPHNRFLRRHKHHGSGHAVHTQLSPPIEHSKRHPARQAEKAEQTLPGEE